MTNANLSPEEILRKKEESGGLIYDDPVEQKPELTEVKEPELQNQSEEASQRVQQFSKIPDPAIPKPPNKKTNLGKVETYSNPLASEGGWKNIPIDIIPSKGLFYPEGTRVAIRPAEVREIRHFSTIDDDDRLDIEEKLSYILDRCLRVDFPGEGVVSYKDLKQEDRFFFIMTIRDLTFVKGENSILLKTKKKCNQTPECPFNEGIELRTGVLSSYEIEEKVMEYYNHESKSFIFKLKKTGRDIEMFVPSIGISQLIYLYTIEAARKDITIDDGFLQIAPFIFDDWRDLSFDSFVKKMRESDYWTKEEYSVYFSLSDKIKVGTTMEAKQNCPICGAMEVTADISFPGGLRSLFVISDIFGELL